MSTFLTPYKEEKEQERRERREKEENLVKWKQENPGQKQYQEEKDVKKKRYPWIFFLIVIYVDSILTIWLLDFLTGERSENLDKK